MNRAAQQLALRLQDQIRSACSQDPALDAIGICGALTSVLCTNYFLNRAKGIPDDRLALDLSLAVARTFLQIHADGVRLEQLFKPGGQPL